MPGLEGLLIFLVSFGSKSFSKYELKYFIWSFFGVFMIQMFHNPNKHRWHKHLKSLVLLWLQADLFSSNSTEKIRRIIVTRFAVLHQFTIGVTELDKVWHMHDTYLVIILIWKLELIIICKCFQWKSLSFSKERQEQFRPVSYHPADFVSLTTSINRHLVFKCWSGPFLLSWSFLRQLHKFQTPESIHHYPSLLRLVIVASGYKKASCLLRTYSTKRLWGFMSESIFHQIKPLLFYISMNHQAGGQWILSGPGFAVEQVHRNKTLSYLSELTPIGS